MNCPKCNLYIPVDYASCPNCGFRPAPDSLSKSDSTYESQTLNSFPADSGSEVSAGQGQPAVEHADKKNADDVAKISTESDARNCPFCAETIKLDAIICRFCRMDLRTGRPVDIRAQPRLGVDNVLKYGCGAIVILIILILLVFLSLLRGCHIEPLISVSYPFGETSVFTTQSVKPSARLSSSNVLPDTDRA